jgi:hypothetical protein
MDTGDAEFYPALPSLQQVNYSYFLNCEDLSTQTQTEDWATEAPESSQKIVNPKAGQQRRRRSSNPRLGNRGTGVVSEDGHGNALLPVHICSFHELVDLDGLVPKDDSKGRQRMVSNRRLSNRGTGIVSKTAGNGPEPKNMVQTEDWATEAPESYQKMGMRTHRSMRTSLSSTRIRHSCLREVVRLSRRV